MGLFKKYHNCPEIGKTIECASFHIDPMRKGGNVKLNLQEDYIEVQDALAIKRIQWQFSESDGTNYIFEGTEEFHQWIIGEFNITHTSENGNQMYIRLEEIRK